MSALGILIGGTLGIVLVLYLIYRSQIYPHFQRCVFCDKNNYLGHSKNPMFERDHLKTYRCSNCHANLFSIYSKGEDENK